MRKIFALITLCLSLQMFALDIPLEPIDPGKRGDGYDRSELIVPTATIENGVINLETAMSSWGVNVTIYNGDF